MHISTNFHTLHQPLSSTPSSVFSTSKHQTNLKQACLREVRCNIFLRIQPRLRLRWFATLQFDKHVGILLATMSAPMKKRAIHIENNSNEDGSGSEGVSDNEGVHYETPEEIQVDFVGRNPTDSDFHGIKQLLQQLFLKAHINLSDLTDVIISQNYVGSVVQQCELDEEDSGDDDDNSNDVFGITTVINLTDKQNLECIQQLRQLLKELCQEHGTDQSNALVNSLLGDDTRPVGLLLNERFINIPAQIAVPLLDSLSKEMERAKEKKLAFEFAYYVIICKLYKVDGAVDNNKKKKKGGKNKMAVTQDTDVLWSNPEEELFDQVADCRFEFSVKSESDSGLSGQWMEDDVTMTPYRRVLLISADKLEPLTQRIKDMLSKK